MNGVLARIKAEKPTLSLDPEASAFAVAEGEDDPYADDDDDADPYADEEPAPPREPHAHS